MIRLSALTIAAASFGLLVSTASGADPQSELEFAAEEIRFFERSIRPILARHCYKCHRAESRPIGGGLRLDTRRHLASGGSRGAAILPGRPSESLLITAIGYQQDDLQMPPDGPMPARDQQLLAEWIRRGAPMPSVQQRSSSEAAEKHWSFQPLAEVTGKPVHNRQASVSTQVDSFIQQHYRRQRVQAVKPATKRELIRRLSFDLHGLLPTPAEVRAFEREKAPDAWSRLVDRYLASPHYGERWGRYWLDLARYTDTTASWLKSTGQAYLYRDWIIQALNADMPYDRFVIYQLAADKQADARPADLAALGFLGLSPTYWKEPRLAQNVIRQIVAEEWEERIDTVGRTFLGMTLACARCHDHKFDPVTIQDYYALAGVFASTRLVDRALLPAAAATRVEQAQQQVFALQEQIDLERKAQQDEKVKQLQAEVEQIKQATPGYDLPLAHGVDDASIYVVANGPDQTKLEYRVGESRDLPVFIRGDPATPGDVVPRRFLELFSPPEATVFGAGSGRGQLARALVDDSGDLLARVIVNRVWLHHFGRGLVDTPSDFGRQGSRPSHPRLLDALSRGLINHGWSLKWLHREILCSSTYRLASQFNSANFDRDPDNRYFWRMNRRRMDIEAWRDTMLAAAGQLDQSIGGAGASLADQGNRRRTVYGLIARRELDQMLRMYGFPLPTGHSPQRETSISALQQLFVLNSEFMRRRASELVQRLSPPAKQFSTASVEQAYQWLFQRTPVEEEMLVARRFIEQALEADNSEFGAWEQFCQALLATNEFAFVD